VTFFVYREEGSEVKPDDPIDPDDPDDSDKPDGSDKPDVSSDKNIPPYAGDDVAETTINRPVLIHVVENDDDPDNSDGGIDPDSIEFSQAKHGAVIIPDNSANVPIISGMLEYTPDPSYVGSDSFTYTVRDMLGAESNLATVRITVIDDDPDDPIDPDDPDDPEDSDGIEVTIIKPQEGFLYLNDKELISLSSTWILGKITFTASITDSTGTVTDIKFYLDEDEIGSFEFDSTKDSYELLFDERTIGLKTLSVIPFVGSNPLEDVAAQIDLKMIIL